MEPVRRIAGKVSVLDRADVDTDQIIPARHLKRVERTGFGRFLFEEWARQPGWLSTKSGFGEPSGRKRQSQNSPCSKPVRAMLFKNCLGMIWSVSTSTRSSGATTPVCLVNGSIRTATRGCRRSGRRWRPPRPWAG